MIGHAERGLLPADPRERAGARAARGPSRPGRPRIAYVCVDGDQPVFSGRPGPAHVQGITRALRRAGADVVVLARRTGGVPPADLTDLPLRIVSPRSESAADRGAAIRNALAGAGPLDAVIDRHAGSSAEAMAFARAAGVPGVVEVPDPGSGTGEGLRQASWVLAASEGAASWSRDAGADSRYVRVVPEGADPERFAPRDAPPVGERFTVAFVGDLTVAGGAETVVEAMALIAPMAPATEALLAGGGPERGALGRYVRAHGLADRVRFAPAPPPDALPALLSGVDVLASPGHPGAGWAVPPGVLEGMAAGLPVVAGRTPGLPRAVEDGRTGLLIPPGDPQALALRLEVLRRDPGLGHRLGARSAPERGKRPHLGPFG